MTIKKISLRILLHSILIIFNYYYGIDNFKVLLNNRIFKQKNIVIALW